MFLYFLVILAWVAAPVTTAWFALAVYGTVTYPGSIVETLDRLAGQRTRFPLGKPFFGAVVSWAFIVAYYYG